MNLHRLTAVETDLRPQDRAGAVAFRAGPHGYGAVGRFANGVPQSLHQEPPDAVAPKTKNRRPGMGGNWPKRAPSSTIEFHTG